MQWFLEVLVTYCILTKNLPKIRRDEKVIEKKFKWITPLIFSQNGDDYEVSGSAVETPAIDDPMLRK